MNTSKLQLLVIIPLLTAGGCATHRVNHPVSRELVQNGKNPECFYVKEKDMDMRNAVRTARKSVPQFIAALQNPTPTMRDFEVKKRFIQGDKVEHIWLSDITYSNKIFHGRVDNCPNKITGLKIGASASVSSGDISDWAYVDHGNLVGGYTIRVLYKELSPERKKEIEHENRFYIRDL